MAGGENIFSNSGCIVWYSAFCAIFDHGSESWGSRPHDVVMLSIAFSFLLRYFFPRI